MKTNRHTKKQKTKSMISIFVTFPLGNKTRKRNKQNGPRFNKLSTKVVEQIAILVGLGTRAGRSVWTGAEWKADEAADDG